ncbi:MAG TPA: sugar ABC transporter permease [Firmicutes bacterium]|nr:sugar ABC transporter permease [Bacillota bacterium]
MKREGTKINCNGGKIILNGFNTKKSFPYLLLLPSMLVLLLFLYWPTLQSFSMSLYRQAPFGIRRFFVGLENYINIFTNPEYLSSLWLTIIYALVTISIGLVVSLLMAVLLNQKLRGIKFYRLVFFIPYAISPAVAGALWVFLLNPVAGHVNYFLYKLFGIQPDWFTNGTLAFVAVAIATIWKNMGFNIIFFLAGLQSISESIYESAKIDGSSPTNTLMKITVPLLSPTTFYLITMNIIFSIFESFGTVDIMTQGGPANATNFLVYSLYRDSFINFRPGLAAAQSVILLFLVIIATIVHFRSGGKYVHYQ